MIDNYGFWRMHEAKLAYEEDKEKNPCNYCTSKGNNCFYCDNYERKNEE